MNTLYITIGNIGSGKSTWSRFFAGRQSNKIYILDADDIRTMLNGGIYDFNPNIECHIKDTLIDLAASLIFYGDVIIDGLNHRKIDREKIITKFKSKCKFNVSKVAVVFPPKDEHLERRLKDSRGYPKDRWRSIFNEVAASFEYPEVSEEFDFVLQVDDAFEFMEMSNFKG